MIKIINHPPDTETLSEPTGQRRTAIYELCPDEISEKQIETALVKIVKHLGGKCRKVRCMENGFFDRHVYLPGGRLYLIELKRPKGGVLSPLQKLTHRDFKRLGFKVFVLWTFEDLANFEKLVS